MFASNMPYFKDYSCNCPEEGHYDDCFRSTHKRWPIELSTTTDTQKLFNYSTQKIFKGIRFAEFPFTVSSGEEEKSDIENSAILMPYYRWDDPTRYQKHYLTITHWEIWLKSTKNGEWRLIVRTNNIAKLLENILNLKTPFFEIRVSGFTKNKYPFICVDQIIWQEGFDSALFSKHIEKLIKEGLKCYSLSGTPRKDSYIYIERESSGVSGVSGDDGIIPF